MGNLSILGSARPGVTTFLLRRVLCSQASDMGVVTCMFGWQASCQIFGELPNLRRGKDCILPAVEIVC